MTSRLCTMGAGRCKEGFGATISYTGSPAKLQSRDMCLVEDLYSYKQRNYECLETS